MEALLFIWIGWGQTQTMAAVRYESVAQCQLARTALLDATNSMSMAAGNVQCIPVPRASPQEPRP